ncbi:hypothetical protein [Marivirga sp.]|uniref:hypothetical protein n=1 Tax=Marivirga sp. TaxID=2018662 RepID=UPI002D7EFA71|nr:hypothetical protein [Marivirga sp.]HET8861047.1 hypothetical protein [Marivirga sp.]
MMKVPLTLFVCFVPSLVAIVVLASPNAAGIIVMLFLLMGTVACLVWGVSIYLKIHREDNQL